jgi:hypothetical protein
VVQTEPSSGAQFPLQQESQVFQQILFFQALSSFQDSGLTLNICCREEIREEQMEIGMGTRPGELEKQGLVGQEREAIIMKMVIMLHILYMSYYTYHIFGCVCECVHTFP